MEGKHSKKRVTAETSGPLGLVEQSPPLQKIKDAVSLATAPRSLSTLASLFAK